MCSGSEAGSYLRLIDFAYHSTLGLRVIKMKKKGRELVLMVQGFDEALLVLARLRSGDTTLCRITGVIFLSHSTSARSVTRLARLPPRSRFLIVLNLRTTTSHRNVVRFETVLQTVIKTVSQSATQTVIRKPQPGIPRSLAPSLHPSL